MGDILRRRALMVQAASPTPPTPTLIYELSTATSTGTYDTGVKLFDTPRDFTILCEGVFSNRNWSSTQSLLGTGTDAMFRIGRGSSLHEYASGNYYTTANRYTAWIMNNLDADTDTFKGVAVFSRFSSTTKQTRRIACKYDHLNKCFYGASDDGVSNYLPNNKWFYLDENITSNETLKLNLGSSGSTINILRIYFELLDNDIINGFLQGN